jgi:hypothetical protein
VLGLLLAALIARQMVRTYSSMRSLGRLRTFYESGLARLSHTWMGQGFQGDEYRDEQHPYADDLDLFGEGSLFELMAVTRTGIGRASLAEWLKTPARREEVLARQAAVDELRGQLQLREAVQLAGVHTVSPCEMETFSMWLESPDLRFPALARVMAAVLPLFWIAAAIAFGLHAVALNAAYTIAAAALVAEGALAWRFRREIQLVLGSIQMPSIDLRLLLNMLHVLLDGHFVSPKIVQLAAGLRSAKAARKVKRLERLVKLLEWRQNAVFILPSWALLWGTQFGMAIEKWRCEHRRDMQRWVSAIGQFEALTALACYAFEHHQDPFPELAEGDAFLDAEGLGHPLLDQRNCQRNDLHLGAEIRLLIVSGSNMSGKSTLLRTVGINTVLAWMGAPVCAHRLRVSNLQISAAIRVQDSLLKGRSHFFAEVSRTRDMLTRAESAPVLYLMDEILSGTNSRDRRIAAEAVIRALVNRGAIGMITTHDLALTQIAQHPELSTVNVHLSDVSDSGGLEFDYKLRPGVLKESNALALIRMLGIPV